MNEIQKEIKGIKNMEKKYIKEYENYLDKTEGFIEIGETKFWASDIIRELDYNEYREGYFNYFDERLTELHKELERCKK